MKTRVAKWGNSLALRIPKSVAREVSLDRDAPVEVLVEDGRLVVVPLTGARVTLESMLKRVTEDNIHHEVDTGSATGRETW
ncbi:MAG: AbrB/MazE/SpoVT family DNA-binding domain-containing protein [Dehalococcoidia bacterium]|nr:AbrB/MazE/SpoVT family DNA-binding domain-containing protein [Dehalococcoidia bacterium]